MSLAHGTTNVTTDGGVLSGDDANSDRFAREHSMALAVLLTSALSMVGSAYILAAVHHTHSASSRRQRRLSQRLSKRAAELAARRPTGFTRRKGLDLLTNPSAVLILNIAVANLLFGCAMLSASVAVLVTPGGNLGAFSANNTMDGDANIVCIVQGSLSYYFATVSAFLCVALSIASFRLTKGKPFVSNRLGTAAVYLICYGVPLGMLSVALALDGVGFQTQNAWCSVVQNEIWFQMVPSVVCVVVVVVVVSLMATFAAKMQRAAAGGADSLGLNDPGGGGGGGRAGRAGCGRAGPCRTCLNLQYLRLVLLCMAFAVVTAMSIVAKLMHAAAEAEGGLEGMQSEDTFSYDIANGVVYCSLGALAALAYGLPQRKVCDALQCKCRETRRLSAPRTGSPSRRHSEMRFDAFFATTQGSIREIAGGDAGLRETLSSVELPEHGSERAGGTASGGGGGGGDDGDFTVI